MKKATVENANNPSLNSPSLPGKPLSLTELKKWISDAEKAPSISLTEAKAIWAKKRKQLEKFTRMELVMKEREQYLAGKGKSYIWEEVKDMAISKKIRK